MAPFNITLKNTDHEFVLNSVRAQIEEAGGTFGVSTFSIKGVSGSYTIAGNTVTITITDKPWYVSNTYLQSAISKYFGDK